MHHIAARLELRIHYSNQKIGFQNTHETHVSHDGDLMWNT